MVRLMVKNRRRRCRPKYDAGQRLRGMGCLRFLSVIVLGLFCHDSAFAVERLVIQAAVNEQPVQFALDTGAERTVLFRRTADRIGLRVEAPSDRLPRPGAGRVRLGVSDVCRLSIGEETYRTQLLILDIPPYLSVKMDGIIAWTDLKNNLLRISVNDQIFSVLKALPENLSVWRKWWMRPDSRLLAIDLPGKADKSRRIYIDTGSPLGVHLRPGRWRRWREENPDAPVTLLSYYSPGDGFVVGKECWARSLVIEGFTVEEVPISRSTPGEIMNFKEHEAILGLFALSRLDVIIDGKHGAFYTRRHPEAAPAYPYNRIGAVFVPKDLHSGALVAHVLAGGPAFDAGIRNGDRLLKIGTRDVTGWRTDPDHIAFHGVWSQPAGSAVNLLLERNGAPYRTTVVLKEIFNRDAAIGSPATERPGSRAKDSDRKP